MAVYVQLPVVDIELEIPDLVAGETIMKRRARLITMTYNQKAKYFTLGWQVNYFENMADGSYGPPINSPGVVPYSVESIGNNLVMVSVATGKILQAAEDGTYAEDYTGQYDYINNLLETTPIVVHDVIRAFADPATF
jgi:hypothetical protein